MFINILTAFEDTLKNILSISKNVSDVLNEKKVDIQIIDIREFGRVDDKAYGGLGMVYKYETLSNAVESIKDWDKADIVMLSPDGTFMNQKVLKELSCKKNIIFVPSRYEGIDDRFVSKYVTHSLSLGPYVISSGEIALLVVLDGLLRMSFLAKKNLECESYYDDRLDVCCYTRPRAIGEEIVPPVFYSGNHSELEEWKVKYKILKTAIMHPQLLKNSFVDKTERKVLLQLFNTLKDILQE